MRLEIILIVSALAVSLQYQRNTRGDHRNKPGRAPSKKPNLPGKTHKSGWGWGNNVDNEIPSYIRPPFCLDPSQINQVPYDPDFFALFRLWYYKGITKYAAVLFSRILLGRYPFSQKELNEMCLSQVFGDYSALLINNGFGRQSGFECSGNVGYSECSALDDPNTYDGALGVNPLAGYAHQVSWIVKTDNETFVIFYVCNDETYGDIQMFTTTQYVSPKQAQIFLDTATTYGIPVDQLQLSVCNSPYRPYGMYPAPFQNYPNSPGNENSGWVSNSGWNQSPSLVGWSKQSHRPPCRLDRFSECWMGKTIDTAEN